MPRGVYTRNKKPTWTHTVVQTMKLIDDFLSAHQLCELTGANYNQITATLHHLQKNKVVDAVLVHDVPFWFLTGEDLRERTVEEREEEPPGSRTRASSRPRGKPKE